MDRWTIALSQTGTQPGADSCVITCMCSFIRVHRVSSVQAWLKWLLGEEVHVLVSDGDMWRTFVFLPARCQLVYCQLCAFRRGMKMGLFSTRSPGAYPCGLSRGSRSRTPAWLWPSGGRELGGACFSLYGWEDCCAQMFMPRMWGGVLLPRLMHLPGSVPQQQQQKQARGGWQGRMGCV